MNKLLAAVLLSAALGTSSTFAQTSGPVAITFDPAKKPVDLVTGNPVTPCTQAQAGSVKFYLERLTEPQEFVTYFKEGVNTIPQNRLWKLVKTQEQWGIWRPWMKGRQDGYPITQCIRSLAVSFVPLDNTGRPGKQVTILLSDLNEINWGNE